MEKILRKIQAALRTSLYNGLFIAIVVLIILFVLFLFIL